MQKDFYHFLAPISNVNDSVLGLTLLPGFEIVNWPKTELIDLIKKLQKLPDHEVESIIDASCWYPDEQDDIRVMEGFIDPGEYWRWIPGSSINGDRYSEYGEYFEKIYRKIQVMRLFKEGHIDITHYYIYKNKHDLVFYMNRPFLPSSPELPLYTLSEGEKKDLEQFFENIRIPFNLPYLQLGFENFEQSFHIDNEALAFLSLMIAAEVLFNVGQQELKYRISRGMAVLLGDTIEKSNEIFHCMKNIYNKRSHLVHSGKDEDISYGDIIILRDYIRKAIVKIFNLNIGSKELSEKLTIVGFGQSIT